MPRKPKSVSTLPQNENVWYCAVRRLKTWVEKEKGEGYFRPYAMCVVELKSEFFLGLELLEQAPAPEDLKNRLVKIMLKPDLRIPIEPHRPAEIHLEEQGLATELEPLLAEIQVGVEYKPQRTNMDALIKSMEESVFGDQGDLPGLLKQRGVAPAQVEALYRAAAAFYRAEPWIQLSNMDLLSIQVQPQKEPYLAIVMGQGGEEYGLSVYRNWDEVESIFTHEDPLEGMPSKGRHAFLFNKPPYVSFDDMDAIERYGWELPAPELYPMPMLYLRNKARRPDAAMLRWYEAALQAIPLFVEQHLQTAPEGSHPPAKAEIQVKTSAGKVKVQIRYPGGDLTQFEPLPIRGLERDEEDEDEDYAEDDKWEEAPAFDRRSMEKILGGLALDLGAESPIEDADLRKAQEVMYDAWDEAKRSRRIALARQALKISKDCADAYVLLAEEDARTDRQALELYQQGVEAGRRALGADFFHDPENIGHFWGILETRPFMRALQGLASTQWRLGQREEALSNYRELLRLNPGDNQGNRYQLLSLSLDLGREEEVRKLLKEYRGDWSPDWAYTSALLAFRQGGDSKQANQALKKAIEVNPHVPAYLTGKKRIPSRLPATITLGGEDQAAVYAADHLNYWRKTPGSVAWLKEKAI